MALLAAAFILVLQISVFATSPADYKKRVESARSGVEELFASSPNADAKIVAVSIAELEDLIPASEKIEWSGGSVETDNRWLRTRLSDFSAEPDKTTRAAILTEVGERLEAIAVSVDDLDRASASTQDKDQEKQKLAEILRRAEYQKPDVQDKSLFQKWLDEFMDWLARIFPKPAIASQTTSASGTLYFIIQIAIYALVIGVVGFLIYKFAPFLAGRFGGREKKIKHDRVILGERIGADESASDLFTDAERLAREGNLRAAIRKGYIALLCDLSDRKILRLARHKTNRDYLKDVRKDRSLFENMTGLTLNFERNWYGLKTADQTDWEDFRTRYLQTIANVKR